MLKTVFRFSTPNLYRAKRLWDYSGQKMLYNIHLERRGSEGGLQKGGFKIDVILRREFKVCLDSS